MRVRDVMTTEVTTVALDTPLRKVAELLVDRRISGVPVCDPAGRVVGVVSEHDLLFKESGRLPRPDHLFWWLFDERDFGELVKAEAVTASDAMTEPPVTVAPDQPIAQAARLSLELIGAANAKPHQILQYKLVRLSPPFVPRAPVFPTRPVPR